jgi:hypothetical protein
VITRAAGPPADHRFDPHGTVTKRVVHDAMLMVAKLFQKIAPLQVLVFTRQERQFLCRLAR